MRTSRVVTLMAAAAVTVAVVAGYVIDRGGGGSAAPGPSPSTSSAALPTSAPPRQPVLAGLDASAPVPTPATVRSDLDADVRKVAAGAHLVGEVVDADTGARLWSREPNQPEPPASTTKLLTAAAALTTLGPNYRLATTTSRSGHTVYLVGGGDPTLVESANSFSSPRYPRPTSLAELARRTVAALGPIHRVRLRLDTTAWSGPTLAVGWKPSYVTEGDVAPVSALELDEGRVDPHDEFAARSEQPAAQAGAAFADLLSADGVTVVGAAVAGAAPTGSIGLAKVQSPPVSELVQRMLTVSDDDLAEALGRAVALKEQFPGSFVGAAAAVTDAVRSLGVLSLGLSLHDTSGLSHRDRITPRALVTVLRAAASPAHRDLRSIIEGLPIAGLTGTLALRYQDHPASSAAGLVRAKTGTLTGVNTLAGLVVDHSGRLLAFAFLTSAAALPGLTVPAIDQLAARLARCGCGS